MARRSSGEKMRVFVAVELSDEAKAEIAGLISAIDALGVRGARTVRPEGVHLTLKFLGDVDAALIPDIQLAMNDSAAGAESFDLSLGDAGVFPNPRAARVLWVGVDGDIERLSRLQRRVESNLATLGFRPERRGFNPHVTIGRLRDGVSRSDRQRVTETLFSHQYARPAVRVESVSLIKTTLHPDGSIYEAIYGVGLTSANQ